LKAEVTRRQRCYLTNLLPENVDFVGNSGSGALAHIFTAGCPKSEWYPFHIRLNACVNTLRKPIRDQHALFQLIIDSASPVYFGIRHVQDTADNL